MRQLTQKELSERYVLGAWFVKVRLMSSRRQLWAREASLIHLENSALQFRKICEMISRMCIAASGFETGTILKSPKAYQVGAVLKALADANKLHFPRHARLAQQPTTDDGTGRWTLDISETTQEDISRIKFIHEQTHKVLHEFSLFGNFPDRNDAPTSVYATLQAMRVDHQWLWNRFWQHAIFINGNLLFVNMGDASRYECPTIIKQKDLLKENVKLDFDPDYLADFSGEIDWSEFNDENVGTSADTPPTPPCPFAPR